MGHSEIPAGSTSKGTGRMALLLAPLVAGCVAMRMLDVSAPSTEPVGETPPAAERVQIAWQFEEGVPVQYFFHFSLKARGDVTINEAAEGIVYLLDTGEANPPAAGATQSGGGFRKMAIRRQELKRRQVLLERGRQIVETSLRDIQPPVSPNTARIENGQHLTAYPVDQYWRFGFREESPFHFVVYDSLTYMLPVLSAKPLTVGDEWSVKIPVIVGRAYNNNEFALSCRQRLERLVRLSSGHLGAEISFSAGGGFDSSAEPYAKRFSDTFRSEQRMQDELGLEGRAIFDLEARLLVWKWMRYTVRISRSAERVKRQPELNTVRTYREEKGYSSEIECTWRLRRPGEGVPVSR